MLTITNEDNMVLMARYPDKYFDIAIVDPPYGISKKKLTGYNTNSGAQTPMGKKYRIGNDWDEKIPDSKYFEQLFRVSKNEIIFGGNYFAHLLPASRGWIYWDKMKYSKKYSAGELAWTSFDNMLYEAKLRYNGFSKPDEIYIHATQKPINLYRWILNKYECHKMKILDTHLGSGSIAIACNELKIDLVACEIDMEMYCKSLKRIEQETSQLNIF